MWLRDRRDGPGIHADASGTSGPDASGGNEVEPDQVVYIKYTLAAMLCNEGKAEWADPELITKPLIPLGQGDRFELVKDRVKRTGK